MYTLLTYSLFCFIPSTSSCSLSSWQVRPSLSCPHHLVTGLHSQILDQDRTNWTSAFVYFSFVY